MNEDKIAPAGEIADNGQEKSYGKFKSAEELLKAYNALEGEFTKRSQKLSEYEKKSAEPDWESKVNKFVGKYPIAEKYVKHLTSVFAHFVKFFICFFINRRLLLRRRIGRSTHDEVPHFVQRVVVPFHG